MNEEDWLHKAEYKVRENEMKISELEDPIKDIGPHLKELEKKFEEYMWKLIDRIELLESRDKIVINNEIFDINKKIEKLEKKIFHDYGGDLNQIEDAAIIQIELVKQVKKLEGKDGEKPKKDIIIVLKADLERWIWELKHEFAREFVIHKIEKYLKEDANEP